MLSLHFIVLIHNEFYFFLDLLGYLVLNFLCGIVTLISSLVYYIVAKTRNSKNRNLKRSSGKPIPRKQNPKSKKPRPTVSASFKKYRGRKMETPYHLTPEYINGVKSGLIELPEGHPFHRQGPGNDFYLGGARII